MAYGAPAELCARGLFCFNPDQPARAGEVNGNFAAVAVGLGTLVAHTTNLAGSETVAEMQARGFALCDGTTPAAQGITAAIITAAMPNLNGPVGRFVRGGASAQSGTLEDDGTAANALTLTDNGHDHLTMVSDGCGSNNGSGGGVDGLGVQYVFRNVNVSGTGSTFSRRTVTWGGVLTCAAGQYATAVARANITVGSSDSETRPVNMRVVWMMRVR